MEEQLIIEIWDTFREHISEKSRETAANQFVDFLIGKDVDSSTLEGLLGYDPHLDDAIEIVLDEHREEDEDIDDLDFGDEEEEDY